MKLLKFEADFCGPCGKQDELMEEYDATSVEHVDVETEEGCARANEFQVRSLPSMILLKDGQPVEQWTGITQPSEIEQAVDGAE